MTNKDEARIREAFDASAKDWSEAIVEGIEQGSAEPQSGRGSRLDRITRPLYLASEEWP